jgi:hypothetical protein
MALEVAADPPLLKPANMTQLPQWQIQLSHLGHLKPSVTEDLFILTHQMQRVIARIHQRQGQQVAVCMTHLRRVN